MRWEYRVIITVRTSEAAKQRIVLVLPSVCWSVCVAYLHKTEKLLIINWRNLVWICVIMNRKVMRFWWPLTFRDKIDGSAQGLLQW